MTRTPRPERYRWAGGEEWLLRWGGEGPATVAVALPLFEEANRTRALAAAMLRGLAARGIGGVLPDLPGQGESLVPTAAATLPDLRAAFAGVPATHAVAIRSGALLVEDPRPCWLLSPQTGPELLRELGRVKGGPLAGATTVRVAGNTLGRTLLDQLATDTPAHAHADARTVRLAGDPRPADRRVDGAPLWRRAEPGDDADLAARLADDIADWIACRAG